MGRSYGTGIEEPKMRAYTRACALSRGCDGSKGRGKERDREGNRVSGEPGAVRRRGMVNALVTIILPNKGVEPIDRLFPHPK